MKTKHFLVSVTTLLVAVCLLLQVFIGQLIFYLKTGMTIEGITAYYAPADQSTRSFIGLSEIYLPHIFSMPLLSFFFGHLLPYIPDLKVYWMKALAGLLIALPVVFLFSAYATSFIHPIFAYSSWFSLVGYEITLLVVVGKMSLSMAKA